MSYSARKKRALIKEGKKNGSLKVTIPGGTLSRNINTVKDSSGKKHTFRSGMWND